MSECALDTFRYAPLLECARKELVLISQYLVRHNGRAGAHVTELVQFSTMEPTATFAEWVHVASYTKGRVDKDIVLATWDCAFLEGIYVLAGGGKRGRRALMDLVVATNRNHLDIYPLWRLAVARIAWSKTRRKYRRPSIIDGPLSSKPPGIDEEIKTPPHPLPRPPRNSAMTLNMPAARAHVLYRKQRARRRLPRIAPRASPNQDASTSRWKGGALCTAEVWSL